MSADIWQIDCDGMPYKPYPGRDNSREALAGEQWVSLTDYRELEEQITAYQLRVDNDLLRLKAAYSLAGSE